jgi:16S rRNA (guanine1207-N2)-methyltransferase
MSHYFTEDASLKHQDIRISYTFHEQTFLFDSDAGLFSKGHIDPASDLLLRTLPPLRGSLLDLGCGYGCLGIVLGKSYDLAVTMADINPRAIQYAKRNAAHNHFTCDMVESDCYANIPGRFDTIVINPPIHAGKVVTYRMYEEAPLHLTDQGHLYVVTLKQHGAPSTVRKLESVFGHCEILLKKKEYYILHCSLTSSH